MAIESVIAFEEKLCEHSDEMPVCTTAKFDEAVTYATISFFGGVLIMAALEYVVHQMMHLFPGKDEKLEMGQTKVALPLERL